MFASALDESKSGEEPGPNAGKGYRDGAVTVMDVSEHRRTGWRAECPTFGPTRGEIRVKSLGGRGGSSRS